MKCGWTLYDLAIMGGNQTRWEDMLVPTKQVTYATLIDIPHCLDCIEHIELISSVVSMA